MKKDDFFVIAYRFLSYLYECAKAGETPRACEMSEEKYGISEKYWYFIVTSLYDDGYIKGVEEVHLPAHIGKVYRINEPQITIKGIEFLQTNSSIEKAKRTLKELKAVVPGL